MKLRIVLAVLVLLAQAEARADIPGAAVLLSADGLCRQAIAAAERAHGIPANLLAAIARVESGRRDQATGTFNPWPWTINMDGQGSFYDTKAQAVAAATAMRPRVEHSIDVGCMQISLVHHPDAFAGMAQAFDPSLNADYGARFLMQLYEKAGSWPKAVELYHSATPELGLDYQRKVYAAWPEEQRLAGAGLPMPWSSFRGATFAAATLPLGARQLTGRVIPQAAGAGGTIAPGRTLEMYRSAPIRLARAGR
nr:lytic transglycosylase domain-containing protein [uncultured Rhodopila sp.]